MKRRSTWWHIPLILVMLIGSCSYSVAVYKECKEFGHSDMYCYRQIVR